MFTARQLQISTMRSVLMFSAAAALVVVQAVIITILLINNRPDEVWNADRPKDSTEQVIPGQDTFAGTHDIVCFDEVWEDGTCTGASGFNDIPYEVELSRQLDSFPLPEIGETQEPFADFLRRSIGYDEIRVREVQTSTILGQRPFGDGILHEKIVSYEYPRIDPRYFYAQHNQASTVVIILHGHVSSALKVLGVERPDYMREAGQVVFEHGYDVIVPDLTVDSNTSSYLNGQLNLYGVQIYGLWSRFVSDIIRTERLVERYGTIVVYGLSNGGAIAETVAVLCDASTLIIVDDIVSDWRDLWKGHTRIHSVQNYGLFFLAPIHSLYPANSYMNASQSPIVYTRSSEIWPEILSSAGFTRPLDPGQPVILFNKEWDYHVAELSTLLSLVQEPFLEQIESLPLFRERLR